MEDDYNEIPDLFGEYIKYYEKRGEIIIVHHLNGNTSIKYNNSKNELEILEKMKVEYIQMETYFNYEYSKGEFEWIELAHLFNFLGMGFCSFANKNLVAKIAASFASFGWGTLLYLDEKKRNKSYNKPYIDYFNKMKYFIYNEDIINLGITKQLEENEANNALEPDLFSINDAAKKDIKELKEIVELISNAYPKEIKQLKLKNRDE